MLPKTGCYMPCGGDLPQPAVVTVNGAAVPVRLQGSRACRGAAGSLSHLTAALLCPLPPPQFCCGTCAGAIVFDPAAGFRCPASGQLVRCLARYAPAEVRNFLPTLRISVAPACPMGWRPFRGPDGFWHCFKCQTGLLTQLPDRAVKCTCPQTCPTDHGYCHPWCW